MKIRHGTSRLPARLRDNTISLSTFKRHLKTFLFFKRSAVGVLLQKTLYINLLFLLLLLSRVCTVVQYAVLEPMATVCGKTKNFVINEER